MNSIASLIRTPTPHTSARYPTPTLTPPHTTLHHWIRPIRSSHTTCTAGINPVFTTLTVEHTTWFQLGHFPHSHTYTLHTTSHHLHQRILSHTNSHTNSHHSTPLDSPNSVVPHHLHRGNKPRFHCFDRSTRNLVLPRSLPPFVRLHPVPAHAIPHQLSHHLTPLRTSRLVRFGHPTPLAPWQSIPFSFSGQQLGFTLITFSFRLPPSALPD